jgi:hypothetical protein
MMVARTSALDFVAHNAVLVSPLRGDWCPQGERRGDARETSRSKKRMRMTDPLRLGPRIEP